MKEFQLHDMDCLKQLIGKSVSNIFYQPVAGILAYTDMFVVNFGEKIDDSLHIFSFFRVINKDKIILTSSDCFFDENFDRLSSELADKSRDELFNGTLLHSNIQRVKDTLNHAKVVNAYCNNVGDVIIEFDNSTIMQILIDALCDQECYRLIHYFDNHSEHEIVECRKAQLYYYTE